MTLMASLKAPLSLRIRFSLILNDMAENHKITTDSIDHYPAYRPLSIFPYVFATIY